MKLKANYNSLMRRLEGVPLSPSAHNGLPVLELNPCQNL